jgi:hypothetical protein
MKPKRTRKEQEQAGDQTPDDEPPKLPAEGMSLFFG